MIKRQRGYTVTELLAVIFFGGAVVLVGSLIYVGIHFLAKVW